MNTSVIKAWKEVVEKEIQASLKSAKELKHKGLIDAACCLAVDALKKASQFKIQILKDSEIRELIKLEVDQCIKTIASISGSSAEKARLQRRVDYLATQINEIEQGYYARVLDRIEEAVLGSLGRTEEAKQGTKSPAVFGEKLNIPLGILSRV